MMRRSSTPHEHSYRAVSTVQTVLSVHVRAGAARLPTFLGSDVYEATCGEAVGDVVRALPEAVPHLVVLALQWLPPGWCPLHEPEAQLLEEPGGVDAHSARWLSLLDGLMPPIGLVEGVVADLITKSLTLARTQRLGEKLTSLLLRAAMHLCTDGTASTFGGLPLWASARWDGLVVKLSGLHFESVSVAFSKRMRSAISSHDQEDLAGLLRVGAVLRVRLTRADSAVFVHEIVSDQIALLARPEVTPSVRCAQLHMLSCLLRQLDFPSAGVGVGTIALRADRRKTVDDHARDLAECAEHLFGLIQQQVFPNVTAIMQSAAASGSSAHGQHDIVHCCMAVLSSVISGAPRAFFEAYGAHHLSLLLRTIRDAAAASAALPCRKALLLVWQLMRGTWSPDPPAVEGHTVHCSDSTPSPFPWSLLHREVSSSRVLRGTEPSECHWMLQGNLHMHKSVRSVFGAAMRTDDAPQKWMTPVIAVLLDPQLLPQPEDHESLHVLAAVTVQIAAHDLERFNEQIMPALLPVSSTSTTKDASVLLATACVRVIADESSGFAEHASKTLLHARSAGGAFQRMLHNTRVRYVQTVARVICDVERRLQADDGVHELGDSWPNYANLDAGYAVRLDGADWGQVDESLRAHSSAGHDSGLQTVDPQKPHHAVASSCLHTAAHCIQGALADETVRVDPEFNRSLDALITTLWSLVRHSACTRSAACLLVTCARMRRRQRCRLIRVGLTLLAQIDLDATFDLHATLGVLCVCMDGWRREIAQMSEPVERIDAYRSMRRDKDALFLIHGIDAAALVLACSAVPRIRVMALRLAATMAALQRDVLDTVAANQKAVAALEHRAWVPAPSSDESWGTGHVSLGAALDELAVPVIEACAPKALPGELSVRAGPIVFAHAAIAATDDDWARCLSEMGARLADRIAGSTLDFAREWIFRFLKGVLQSGVANEQSRERFWQHSLLLSLGPREVDVMDAQTEQNLCDYLGHCWDTYFEHDALMSRGLSGAPELTPLQREVIDPVCWSANWRSVRTVVQSLLDWRMRMTGASTERTTQPVVLHILRRLATHSSFERACSDLSLVEASLRLIACEEFLPAVTFAHPDGKLSPSDILQRHDYAMTVTGLAQGILAVANTNEAAVHVWSVESRQRVIQQLQLWAKVGTTAPLISASPGTETAQLVRSLQHESICAIIGIVRIAPLVISDSFWSWTLEAEKLGYRVLRWILHHHFDEVGPNCLDFVFGGDAKLAEIASFALVSNFVATPMEPTPQVSTKLVAGDCVPVEPHRFQTKLCRIRMLVEIVHFALVSLMSTSTSMRVGGIDLLQAIVPWIVDLPGFGRDGTSDTSLTFNVSRAMRGSILIGDVRSRENAMAIVRLASDCAPMLAALLFEYSFERLATIAAGSGVLMDSDWMWDILQAWGFHIHIVSGPAEGFLPRVMQTLSADARDLVKSTKYTVAADFFDDLVDASLCAWHRSSAGVVPSNVLRVWNTLGHVDRKGQRDKSIVPFMLDCIVTRLHTMREVDQELMYCVAESFLSADESVVVKYLSEHFSNCLKDGSFGASTSGSDLLNQLGAMRILVEFISRGRAVSLQELIPQILVFLLLKLDSVVKCDTAPLIALQSGIVRPTILHGPRSQNRFGLDNTEQYTLQCMLSRLLLVITGGLGADDETRSGTADGWEACSALEDIAEQLSSHRTCVLVWDVSSLGNCTDQRNEIAWNLDEHTSHALRAIADTNRVRPKDGDDLLGGVENVDRSAAVSASCMLHHLHNTLMGSTANNAGIVPSWAMDLLSTVAKTTLELMSQSKVAHVQLKSHQIYRTFLSRELLGQQQHRPLPISEQLESMVGCMVDILDASDTNIDTGQARRIGTLTEGLNTLVCCAHAGAAVDEPLFVGVCACLLRCGVQILPSMQQTVHWNVVRTLLWQRGIDLLAAMLSCRDTRQWLCNPDTGRDQYMSQLCQRLGFDGIVELLQANTVDETALMAPQAALAVGSALLLHTDPPRSATSHFTLALSTLLFLHGIFSWEVVRERAATVGVGDEIFRSICIDLAEMMGAVCSQDHAAAAAAVPPGMVREGGVHRQYSDGLAERLAEVLRTAALEAPYFPVDEDTISGDGTETEPAADRFLRAAGQRLAAIYLPTHAMDAVSFLMDVVQHSPSARRVSSAMAMTHVFLTEHPDVDKYASHFQPLIHRAVQWLGSAPSGPSAPQVNGSAQLEHHRRRGYCVQIVSRLHSLSFIDHQALLQRLPAASAPWHAPLNAVQAVNAWGFVLALNPSASGAIRAVGVTDSQPSTLPLPSSRRLPIQAVATGSATQSSDAASVAALPRTVPSPARKPRLLPPTPPPRPAAALTTDARVEPCTPVLRSDHKQMQAIESPSMMPSSVGGPSPSRHGDISDGDLEAAMVLPNGGRFGIAISGAAHSLREDRSLATEHRSVIDAHHSLLTRGDGACSLGSTGVVLHVPAVDGASDGSGELLLEHDGSWSETQESSDDQGNSSEWGDNTPVRARGTMVCRYTQQELDEYEHELALDPSASGIEALDLVENELRHEKVNELLAAVGASPEEKQRRYTDLGPRRDVNEGAEMGGTALRAGGDDEDAYSSTQLRAKFAHLLR